METDSMAKVSILIAHRNDFEYLPGCFDSIREKITVPYEVIMVDNNSTDGAPDMVEERYPWVKLIRSSDNLGFAAGCNLAARHATGDYFLLLNSDTILQTDILDTVKVVDEAPGVGAVGVAMFGGDGAKRFSCAQFPTPARLWSFGRIWHDPTVTEKPWPSTSTVPVYHCDYVEGSFLLTRADAWKKLGGIDERNYMYGDDVEYCRSLLEIGLQTVHCPSVRYTHFGGYNHARMGYLFAGGRRYHRKFSSRWVQFQADFVLRAGLLLRIPWYWLRSKQRKDFESRSALHYALAVNRDWANTLVDGYRFPVYRAEEDEEVK
jgi:N-acetylglucosaminyl-diphospho-decaprenol L-rhamnosyltransferase